MRVVATSDCHGFLPEVKLPEGDVLVVAGDILSNSQRGDPRRDAIWQLNKLEALDAWFATLPFKKIVVVAGNHDWCFQFSSEGCRRILKHAIYLEGESCEIDGVRFFGDPHQPWFYDWAFNFDRNDPGRGYKEAKKTWAKIPLGTDVLVTHGPPHGVLDECMDGRLVGCPILKQRVLGEVKPKFHVFGHIHHSYGRKTIGPTEFLNVALCDERYEPVQPPLVFDV